MRNDRITLAQEVCEEILCLLEKMNGRTHGDDRDRLWKAVFNARQKFYVTLGTHPCNPNIHITSSVRSVENVGILRKTMAPGTATYCVNYGVVTRYRDEDMFREYGFLLRQCESEREPGYMRKFHEGGGDCPRPKGRFKVHSKRDPELSITKFDQDYSGFGVSMF